MTTTEKTDEALAAEIRSLMLALTALFNEAQDRDIRINFNIAQAGPGAPFALMNCAIERVKKL